MISEGDGHGGEWRWVDTSRREVLVHYPSLFKLLCALPAWREEAGGPRAKWKKSREERR